jgi:hypothetical protein
MGGTSGAAVLIGAQMSVAVDLANALDKACEDKSLTEMEISRRGVFSVW